MSSENIPGPVERENLWEGKNGNGRMVRANTAWIFQKSIGAEVQHKPATSKLPSPCPLTAGVSTGGGASPIREGWGQVSQQKRRDNPQQEAVGRGRPEGLYRGAEDGILNKMLVGIRDWGSPRFRRGRKQHPSQSHYSLTGETRLRRPQGILCRLTQTQNFQQGTTVGWWALVLPY